jgi:hypothetical protein
MAPMRLLIDNGVVSASDFLEGDSRTQQLTWGPKAVSSTIAGFRRVKALSDPAQQREVNALFTVGRLLRERRLEIFTYTELMAEMWRRPRGREPILNAFGDCRPKRCLSALERSKFRNTVNIDEWFAKGDKRDRDKGRSVTDFNQVPYFQWLATLSERKVQFLVDHAASFRLTEFEIDSLRDLAWFQKLFKLLNSSEKHLPDCFHVWTARRNELDAFLSLEKALPRVIGQLKARSNLGFNLDLGVLRPSQLLELLGISAPDSVPVEFGRFYSYMEIFSLRDKVLQ